MQVRFTDTAEKDLEGIWNYIFQESDSEDRARKMLRRILEGIALLESNPQLGRLRPDICPDIRSSVIRKYVVLYRLRSESIEIMRIVHGSRKLALLQLH